LKTGSDVPLEYKVGDIVSVNVLNIPVTLGDPLVSRWGEEEDRGIDISRGVSGAPIGESPRKEVVGDGSFLGEECVWFLASGSSKFP